MASTYLELSDQELLKRFLKAEGALMIDLLDKRSETGTFNVGMRDQTTGAFLTLSTHAEKAVAEQVARELVTRLDCLAASRTRLTMPSLPGEPGNGQRGHQR